MSVKGVSRTPAHLLRVEATSSILRQKVPTVSRCLGSVQECVPFPELARRRILLNDGQHAELKSRLEEIARMLSGLIKGLENRDA